MFVLPLNTKHIQFDAWRCISELNQIQQFSSSRATADDSQLVAFETSDYNKCNIKHKSWARMPKRF